MRSRMSMRIHYDLRINTYFNLVKNAMPPFVDIVRVRLSPSFDSSHSSTVTTSKGRLGDLAAVTVGPGAIRLTSFRPRHLVTGSESTRPVSELYSGLPSV